MKKTIKNFAKMSLSLLMLPLFLFQSTLAIADSVSDPTIGPSQTVGIVEQVGPIEPTGPIEPVGPIEPTGPQEVTVIESNQATGENSQNQNETNLTDSLDAQVDNNAVIENDQTLSMVSGDNTLSNNTGVESLSTGNIDGTINIVNITNTVLAPGSSINGKTIDGSNYGDLTIGSIQQPNSVLLPSSQLQNMQQNGTTGSNSSNFNLLDSNNVVAIINNNDSSINNGIGITADTGNNQILCNTDIGNITTGDITLATNLLNLANIIDPNLILNLDSWNVIHGLNGDIIIPVLSNSETGANSDNANLLNASLLTNLGLNNNSTINNGLSLDLSTGKNLFDSNTAIGDIIAGDSSIASNLLNLTNANSGIFYVINVFGQWFGKAFGVIPSGIEINQIDPETNNFETVFGSLASDNLELTAAETENSNTIDSSNNSTGSNSENLNETEIENQTDITQNNNSAIDNNIDFKANTGKNTFGNNTAIGNIKTGSIEILSNIINFTNSVSNSARKIRIGIVNIFGNWTGNLGKAPTPFKPPAEADNLAEQKLPSDPADSADSAAVPDSQNNLDSAPIVSSVITSDMPKNDSANSNVGTLKPYTFAAKKLKRAVVSTLAENTPQKSNDLIAQAKSSLPDSGGNLPFGGWQLLTIPAVALILSLVAERTIAAKRKSS